jgi:hypothetical protein
VKDGEETDLRSEMLGIGRDGSHRFSRGLEEDAVDYLLVLVGHRGDLRWHGKDHVKIRNLQEFGLAILDPLRPGQRLTFGAMSIRATVVAIPLMATLIALLQVATEGRRAAVLDGAHDAPLRRGHRRALLIPISLAVAAKDISHFQLRTLHGPRSEVVGRCGLWRSGNRVWEKVEWTGS